MEVIRNLGPSIPILGVCLGHQCIGAAFGAVVIRAPRLMHGKTSLVYHSSSGVLSGLPSPFQAARYHSLCVSSPLPECLEMTAATDEGEVMGMRHRRYPIHGVQFHPESILTDCGKLIIENFLSDLEDA